MKRRVNSSLAEQGPGSLSDHSQDHMLDRALRQGEAYQFLSAVYLQGLTPALYAQAADIPVLLPLLSRLDDANHAAAEYEELFGFNVFPYAGVFLTEDGQLGGRFTHDLKVKYDRWNYQPSTDVAPDHLGCMLAYLAYLSDVEARALSHGDKAGLHRVQAEQHTFLVQYIVSWLPVFIHALTLHGQLFYAEIADLTEALIIRHLQELADHVQPEPDEHEMEVFLKPPDILGDEKTGIKDIAAYFMRSAKSGVFLSRKDVRFAGNMLKLPAGFGDRTLMLSNAFQSAINFGEVIPFIDHVMDLVTSFRDYYITLKRTDLHVIHEILDTWIARVEHSLDILCKLRDGHQLMNQETPI